MAHDRLLRALSGVALIGTLWIVPLPAQSPVPAAGYSSYIFAWVGQGERKTSDFLAVIDADPTSHAYGRVVASVPAKAVGTMPHHTEYEFPADAQMIANGWAAGQTFVFNLAQPTAPTLASSFRGVGAYGFPHSFVRLANGNVLAVFQGNKDAYAPPGGLVEMDIRGTPVRFSSAATEAVDSSVIWPYSLEVDATHDRIVTTSTPMGLPPWSKLPAGSWPSAKTDSIVTRHVQVWSLSDLRLVSTMSLPESGKGKHHQFPAEPRLLPDGSIYVNTFSCGLYRVTGLDGAQPDVRFVHAFPGGEDLHSQCAVPVVVGRFWIQSVAAVNGLIVLDVSNPAKPFEVARLQLEAAYHMPHWIAADRKGSRLVVTGDDQSYVLIVNVDPNTGMLRVDNRFTDEMTGAIGVNLTRRRWPHGPGGTAKVHGALFGPR